MLEEEASVNKIWLQLHYVFLKNPRHKILDKSTTSEPKKLHLNAPRIPEATSSWSLNIQGEITKPNTTSHWSVLSCIMPISRSMIVSFSAPPHWWTSPRKRLAEDGWKIKRRRRKEEGNDRGKEAESLNGAELLQVCREYLSDCSLQFHGFGLRAPWLFPPLPLNRR